MIDGHLQRNRRPKVHKPTQAKIRRAVRQNQRWDRIGAMIHAKGQRKIASLTHWHQLEDGSGAWRVGGWWHNINCPKCGQRRYSYKRMGIVRVSVKDGRKQVRRTAWPPSTYGANDFTREVLPGESSRPAKLCRCLVEP